jgi:ABC-2 type transport system ATP-binding protein
MSANEATVIASGMVKRFGDFTAVGGVDITVREGEIFGLLGPNGSGKTTSIRMMLGLMPPTSGDVKVLGISVQEHPERIRPRVGYMSQQFSLYSDLTVIQNLRFYGAAYGVERSRLSDRLAEVLRMAGLEGRESTPTRALSGGWRQRLALGAAILHEPEVLFLDEPTAGVDPLSRREFWDLLYHLVAGGVTALVTTHYMDEAEHCHRLAFIQRGKIIASGSPEQIRQRTMPEDVLEIIPSDATAALNALRKAMSTGRLQAETIDPYGSRLHLIARDAVNQQDTVRQVLKAAGVQVLGSQMIEPSLEDVFIRAMG